MANQVKSSIFKSFTVTFAIFVLIFTFHGFPMNPIKLPYFKRSKLYYQNTFLSLGSNETVSRYHRTLTLHPHLAGTTESHKVTDFVKRQLRNLGFEVKTVEYEVLLSYSTRASLTSRFGDVGSIRELFVSDDTRVVKPYHAYAPSGTVVGAAVYVNYGREEDYNALVGLGVNVSGCVVLVKRGGGELSRGDLVRKAAEKGALAVLTYTEGVYVKGVERGTVMKGVGDPLSPGWGSVFGGGERLGRGDDEVVKRFPRISSMPVSMETAEAILGSLEGPQVPLGWRVGDPKVRVGPGPTLLNFSYQVGTDYNM